MFLFPSHSLLLGFDSISLGIVLLDHSSMSRIRASCRLLCQTEHVLPRCSLRARGTRVSGGSMCSTGISAADEEYSLAGCWLELACCRGGVDNGWSSCLETKGAELSSRHSCPSCSRWMELHKLLVKTWSGDIAASKTALF